MPKPGRTRERLIALFFLGVLLFAPPLLIVFNAPARILGVPALYLYLFVAWVLLIALLALAIERADAADDLGDEGRERPATAGQQAAGEPTDA